MSRRQPVRARALWLAVLLAGSAPWPTTVWAQTLPEWGRPLSPAQARELRDQISRLSQQLGVRNQTLRAIAKAVGASNPNVSFSDLQERVRSQAQSAAELRSRIAELQRTVATLATETKKPAEEALARATRAFNAGRLEEAAREFAALESLRASETASARLAWRQAVDARARIEELQLDYDEAAEIRLRAASSVREDRERSQREEWELLVAAADSKRAHGLARGGKPALDEALQIGLAALQLAPKTDRPLDWAKTQHTLGHIYWALGVQSAASRQPQTSPGASTFEQAAEALLAAEEAGAFARFDQAASAFRSAAEVYRRDQHPLEWGYAMVGLADTLTAHGEAERFTGRISQGIDVYRQALEVITAARAPRQRVMALNNLANALSMVGSAEPGSVRLREAAAALEEALALQGRSAMPSMWAVSKHNLGVALTALGRRERNAERLREAVAAYSASLEVRTRAVDAGEWASSTINLANAKTDLAALTRDTGLLGDAEKQALAARAEFAAGSMTGVRAADRLLLRIAVIRAQLAESPPASPN